MYIDGEWQSAASGKTFASINPANGAVLDSVPDGEREDARRAIDAAAAALPDWRSRTAYERAEVLVEAHRIMLERRDDLAELMTREQGKPLRMARTEVGYAADFLLWFAEEAKRVYGEVIPSARADQRFIVLAQPVGVCAAITPWNYPISMLTRKLAPALAAGCTSVLKPAEQTPLCAVETFKVFADAGVPAGVVNLVTCSDPEPVADELLGDPRVRKISFTGSTEVGRMIASRAGATMKRVSMELGGHAPFLVFPDADPEHAAKGGAAVKFLNTGQACICPNRFIVHRSIAEPFIATLRARIEKLVPGDGLAAGTTVGPLIDEVALKKMQRQVDDAVDKGAKLELGGSRLQGPAFDNGHFYAPTILTGVTPDMLICSEETFGPIAPVMVFDDEDEAIAMANSTEYGLAGYIYTRDISRAIRVGEALDFGMIGINDINPTSAAVPFGGIKQSGLGREGARAGIEEYLDTKVLGIAL
ncbi:NAD-dependent succinate-semialdehyde dehydrogenase [Mycolicibacterium thermoresistibile]|uniref:Aldehyde dehydrogenase n=2 Tax=Mycolicibacterium thermoresistibile TaxID=1797 RepID=G7CFV0_MYCT3|nr:NAD-dependent succinate-semialdehyde dehydrogenase [Mycolicibacterium thermoresistibile]EHI13379.1 aldehyde dehydrogenase [Mycolicibacterium thermoresistibile ATCC 19527]MCV7189171.1 NAD-dependent succinate-semialdehyde dehydrogenase [Mycolicibacterium thermoresistibile]GAT14639.1 NAD-dependent aldehyde dehydrogenase [Mycolicibacterium thermoresistibile]SNW19866.1 NAD-dependent aldehyde dehydrogenase [Mycolicibacterium thermoresistibile]